VEKNSLDRPALLIAVLATVLPPLTEAGNWEPINSVVSGIVLLIALCFSGGNRNLHGRERIGAAAAAGLMLATVLAWPIQDLFSLTPDNAFIVAAIVGQLIVGLAAWFTRVPTP
jgi:hypothetical protein